MTDIPSDLRALLERHGQQHVLRWWPSLTAEDRQGLVGQLRSIDLEEIERLYARKGETTAAPEQERLSSLPHPEEEDKPEEIVRGRQELAEGKVAFLVVAGGQGTRLGFDRPKGLFPIGPVTGRTLFQLFAEKIRALGRRYGKKFPFLVMTSTATDASTQAFFAENDRFGLDRDQVRFFRQGNMPAVDFEGKLLLEAPGRLFLGPDGHGGCLTALNTSGLLEDLHGRGIRTLHYFQVDNPLVDLADAAFLGRHLLREAEVSCKVISKGRPTDKLGNFVLIDGRLGMVEYSDLTEERAHLRDDRGRLFFWAGNPAIHLFDLDFLRRVVGSGKDESLPWHIARKKVPYLDVSGKQVDPERPNAFKFERFIFDVLPWARRWNMVATSRRAEFEPLKNAEGSESPATVRQALSDEAAGLLEAVGVRVPRDAQGHAAVPLEISPLFALDAEELAEKVGPDTKIEGPTSFEPASVR